MSYSWERVGLTHHDAAGQVVEHGGFECEHLPTYDGVGQRQADEEWLEGHQCRVREEAEALGRGAEGLGCPFSDGVRNRLVHGHRPAVSRHHNKTKLLHQTTHPKGLVSIGVII